MLCKSPLPDWPFYQSQHIHKQDINWNVCGLKPASSLVRESRIFIWIVHNSWPHVCVLVIHVTHKLFMTGELKLFKERESSDVRHILWDQNGILIVFGRFWQWLIVSVRSAESGSAWLFGETWEGGVKSQPKLIYYQIWITFQELLTLTKKHRHPLVAG